MCKTHPFLVIAFVGLLSLTTKASDAAILTYQFEATVQGFGFAPAQTFTPTAIAEMGTVGVGVGAVVNGTVVIDSDAGSLVNASFSVGQLVYTLENVLSVSVDNNSSVTGDYITVAGVYGESTDSFSVAAALQLQDSSSQVLQDTMFPSSINLDAFDPFELYDLGGTGFFWLATFAGETNMIQAELTSITAVPVPPAVWLFLSAILGVCRLKRR